MDPILETLVQRTIPVPEDQKLLKKRTENERGHKITPNIRKMSNYSENKTTSDKQESNQKFIFHFFRNRATTQGHSYCISVAHLA